ncbi:MAG: uridine diphosphate-N-acetylglucosamine-binding protein YvcK [Candidatus Pacebacteria bacterium]|nr:uridine diphosphate-N-acetylglucosamine-binding protein YvcK [Candidatus Paceibacterota bacterium]
MKFAIEKEINEIPKILRKRKKISLKKFSSLLKEPILITGISSSIDLPGLNAVSIADKLGVNVRVLYANEVENFSANTLIVISHSGETDEIVRVLKNSKAKVKIAITSNKNSIIARLATHVIPMICGDQISNMATKTVAEQYYIVSQLITEKFGAYHPIKEEEIKQIEENLKLDFSEDLTNKFVKTKRVVIVGNRGLSQELETKFEEIARTQAETVYGPIIFDSAIEVLTQGEIILVCDPEKMRNYRELLAKTSRAKEIIYVDKFGIKAKGDYKPIIRYAGFLKFIVKVGIAKDLNVDHPEVFIRTHKGLYLQNSSVKRVVIIGGGSGIIPLLKAFKKLGQNLWGVTSMVDSGGSTGKLRRSYDVSPAGDIRRIIAALSDNVGMLELINYRFKGGELDTHTLGNILLAALEKTRGIEEGKEEIERLLGAKGKAFSVTLDKCNIYAKLKNGHILNGESEIDLPLRNPFLKIKKVWLKPEVRISEKVKEALLGADFIVIGPGDLYSSLMPNLLVKGIAEAMKKSKAKKVYVCNAMTKLGETTTYTVSDFVNEVEKYLGKNILDYVIYNQKIPSRTKISEYQKESHLVYDYVKFDRKKLSKKISPKIVGADLFLDANGPIVHDPDVLAKIILSLI